MKKIYKENIYKETVIDKIIKNKRMSVNSFEKCDKGRN